MAKILVNGIFLFITLGFLIIGALVINNNIKTVDNSNWEIREAQFTEMDNKGYYIEFKLRIKVIFGELSVTKIESNLNNWDEIKGLNNKAGANQFLEIYIKKGENGQRITQNTDLSQLWIHFYLSDSSLINWSDNTQTIE